MNTPTPGDGDDDFDARLRTRRRFVPRFDDGVDDAEPSPELDRIVLARARAELRPAAAVAPRDTDGRHYRGPRWAMPLALVATVLLSFALVMQLDPARNDVVLAPRAAAPEAALAEAEAVAPAPATAAAPTTATAAAPAAAPAPAPAPAAEMLQAPVAISAPATRATSAAAATAPGDSADFALGDAAVATAPAQPAPPLATHREAAAAPYDSRTDAAASVAADAAAVGSTRAQARMAAPAENAAMARTAKERGAEARAELATSAAVDEDPLAWLARIERLRNAGEVDAARTQLVEFRRRHPEVELPPALRELR